jgi:hypothetical protein
MKVSQDKLAQALIFLQLIAALLGCVHHSYQIWHEFNLGNHSQSVSLNLVTVGRAYQNLETFQRPLSTMFPLLPGQFPRPHSPARL